MHDADHPPRLNVRAAALSLRAAWPRLLRRTARSATFRIAAFALGVRVFTSVMAFIVNVVFPLAQKQQFTVTDRTHLLWDTFARYDSGWYFGIARHGYEFVEGGRSNLAFFPVYPLLMRYVGLALGGGRQNLYLAGVIISWVAYVLAMVVLYRLARTYYSRAAAERTVMFASVFPFAFFYGVVYSEAVFLLFTVTAFYGFRTKRWWLGAAAGALACATRVNGIMALPALALLAWQSAGGDRAARMRALAAAALVPVGLVLYSAYVNSLSGSYVEWSQSIQRWNYSIAGSPLRGFSFLMTQLATQPYLYITTDPMAPYDVLHGLTALAFIVSLPFVGRRAGAAYVVHMALNLWLPLSSGVFEGVGRYCAVLFPFFFVMATIRPVMLRTGLLVASAALYMLCLALWVNLHPIF
ncbi:MAG: mannosyltransferase family protein [Vicinamibacterales bacterium]